MKEIREARVVPLLLLAALSAWASMQSAGATVAGGTGSADSGPAAVAAPAALDAQRFAADLRGCRNAAGGRPAHRSLLAPGHPRIANCLRLRGWWPDGTPALERLLQRG